MIRYRKIRGLLPFVFATVLYVLISTSATACGSDGPPPTLDEMLEAEEVFISTQSLLQRVAAYGTLLRTEDPNLRQTVIEMGLDRIDDDNIRGAALHCMFVISSILTINSMPLADANDAMPDMTERARELVINGRTESLQFYYTNAVESCASINLHSDDECPADRSAVVSGTSIAFRDGRSLIGRFELNDENMLVGEIGIWNGSGHDVIPAKAVLD